MKIRAHIFSALFPIFLLGCSTTGETDKPVIPLAKLDNSIASTLYETGLEFEEKRAEGDSLGMAYAARRRADIIESLTRNGHDRTAVYAISASTRNMISKARYAADGDKQILLRIERLFPSQTRAQASTNQSYNSLFGKPRKVEVTIGLEMDVRLNAGAVESKIVPVNSATPTTVFVHPGLGSSENNLDLNLTVSAVGKATSSNSVAACNIKDRSQEYACVIQPGDFSEIEITILNKSKSNTNLLVFVSGNATSLAAAFAPE